MFSRLSLLRGQSTRLASLPSIWAVRGPSMILSPQNLQSQRWYSGPPPPLTREFVQERIIDVLSNCDKVNAEKLVPSATFEELGLDSLDVVDALFYIEEEFTVEMPDHEADAIKTVGDAVDWVLKQPDAY